MASQTVRPKMTNNEKPRAITVALALPSQITNKRASHPSDPTSHIRPHPPAPRRYFTSNLNSNSILPNHTSPPQIICPAKQTQTPKAPHHHILPPRQRHSNTGTIWLPRIPPIRHEISAANCWLFGFAGEDGIMALV